MKPITATMVALALMVMLIGSVSAVALSANIESSDFISVSTDLVSTTSDTTCTQGTSGANCANTTTSTLTGMYGSNMLGLGGNSRYATSMATTTGGITTTREVTWTGRGGSAILSEYSGYNAITAPTTTSGCANAGAGCAATTGTATYDLSLARTNFVLDSGRITTGTSTGVTGHDYTMDATGTGSGTAQFNGIKMTGTLGQGTANVNGDTRFSASYGVIGKFNMSTRYTFK